MARKEAPTAREEAPIEVDKRKRNSLIVSVADWVEADYGRDESKVEALLSKRNKVSSAAADPRGTRAAKIAQSIALGNMRTLREQVIAHFAQINKRYPTFGGDTLLHITCREGFLRMVEFIVDPRNISQFDRTVINYDAENDKKRTPLHVAFTPPHETFCGKRLGIENSAPRSRRPEDLVSGDQDWVRPGTEEDRQRVVEVLVNKGASVGRLDYHSHSPLHYACIWGWTRTVAFLLERGADAEVTNNIGQNALMAATEYKHAQTVELLIDRTDVPLEAKNVEGETALLYAIAAGHVAAVEILCQFGANTNAASYKKDDTALRRACRANDTDIVSILLDYQVARDDAALSLLRGDARDVVMDRLERERQDKQREFEAAQLALVREVDDCADVGGRPRGSRSAIGQWVPYRDKRGRGIFYYNKVSRVSQFEVPVDYQKDPRYVVRDATYGMHFYH